LTAVQGLAGFCQTMENGFFREKNRTGKNIFLPAKNRFLPEYIFIEMKFINFS